MRFDFEIVAAAFVPAIVVLIVATLAPLDAAARTAIRRWFVPLTLVWFAPFWISGGSPVPFDFLFAYSDPWKAFAPPRFAPSNPLLNDIPLQLVPWRDVVTEAFRNGELPLLNRYAGSGSALWESPLQAILNPLTLLGLPFSSFAWPLFTSVAKMLIAASGMYFFLRSDGRSEVAARAGGIAYGFGAFQFAYLLYQPTNVTALVPWLLLAIAKLSVFPAAILVALLFLSGHPESVMMTAYVAIPFAIVVIRRQADKRRAFLRLACAAVAGALIAAPAIVPFLRYLPLSERAAWLEQQPELIRSRALSIRNLVPFVLPAHLDHTRLTAEAEHFNDTATQYAGLSMFVLFVLGITVAPRRNRFWIALFGVFFLLIFELPPVRAVLAQIPLVRLTFHDRLRFAVALITIVVAARAFDELADRTRRLAIIGAIAAAAVVLAAADGWAIYQQFGTGGRVAASAGAALLGLAAIVAPPLRRWLPLFVFVDLAALGMIFHEPNGRETYYPRTPAIESLATGARTPYRVVGLGDAVAPNTAAMFRLEDIRTHDAMAFAPYIRLLQAAGYDRRYYLGAFHLVPPRVLLDFLGVRYLVAGPRAKASWPESYRGRDGVVFRNDGALPRFFVPRQVTGAPFGSQDDARVVHVESPSGVKLAAATVELVRYGLSSAEVRVRAAGETFLASSEVALPGWRVERNGEPWPMTRINAVFLGWRVPAGEQRFVMRYWPPGLTLSLALSVAGVVLLAAGARWLRVTS